MTTALATAYWQDRHPGVERLKWLQGYWESWRAPHRQAVLDGLWRADQTRPLHSVAEVGCHVGPNLRLIAQRGKLARPLTLYGLDVNAEALAFGEAQAETDRWGDRVQTRWIEGSALEIEAKLPLVDLIFSCYALAYVGPNELTDVLDQMASRSRYVLLVEPSTQWYAPRGICGPGPEWRHDYFAAWPAWRSIERLTVWHVRPEADRLDTAMLLELSPSPSPQIGDSRHG